MLAVISPAKKLDTTPVSPMRGAPFTEPALLADAKVAHAAAKKLSTKALGELMDLSEALAELNHDRFQVWKVEHRLGDNDCKPAALMFAGEVYSGLEASTLSAKTLAYAQDHLAILSGLYGVLRPLDLIQPYRLEMGSKLVTRRGKDLYQFWGERLAKLINERAGAHADPTLVNLASTEYMKAVPRKALTVPVRDVAFKELKDGKAVTLMLFAKRARGLMARFIIEQKVDNALGLKDFASDDYRFDPARSNDAEWVFSRSYRTLATAANAARDED